MRFSDKERKAKERVKGHVPRWALAHLNSTTILGGKLGESVDPSLRRSTESWSSLADLRTSGLDIFKSIKTAVPPETTRGNKTKLCSVSLHAEG